MSFTDQQLKAMAITPKTASGLSIPGSLFIIYEVISDIRHGKGGSAMKRSLLGMSCVDILSSIGWFLSTWAAPVESGAPFASGTNGTCAFQGFLLQIAIGAPLYNGALVLYYLLVIKYQWSNEKLIKIEPWLHAFIWIWCLGTSATLLGLRLFNFIGPVCWVSDPPECFEDIVSDGVKCGTSKYFATAFFCIPLWIVILATIVALTNIYCVVRGTAQRMSKYNVRGSIQSMHRTNGNVQSVASRAVMYSMAFVITWTASTIWSFAQFFDYYPFWVSYLWTLLEPLQGFWNFLIFIHNRPESKHKVKRLLTCGLWKQSLPEDETRRGLSTTQGASGRSSWGVLFRNSKTPSTNIGQESFRAAAEKTLATDGKAAAAAAATMQVQPEYDSTPHIVGVAE